MRCCLAVLGACVLLLSSSWSAMGQSAEGQWSSALRPVAASTEAVALPPAPWPVWTSAAVTVPASITGNTYYIDGKFGKDTNDGRFLASAFATVKSRPCRIHLSPASQSHGILDDGLRRGDGAGFASFVRVGKTWSKQARHANTAERA